MALPVPRPMTRRKKFFWFFSFTKRTAYLLFAVCAALPAQAASIGGSFTLTNGDGHVVTEQNYRGKFLLVFFGYANCPDQCPTTLYNIAQALIILGVTGKDLKILFITIDPARDTPDLAARYAALFSPDIIGLSGSPAQVKQVEQDYHVYVAANPQSGIIAHSSLIYLLNPAGGFLTTFPGTITPPELATQIAGQMGK
jgi:protein SCO1/2